MIEFQDGDGLVFWDKYKVASITPEYRNRWRGVKDDGSVAHRPSPPPPGPWALLGDSLVWPGLLRPCPQGWLDPANFLLPAGQLPDLQPPPPQPDIPGLDCRRFEIYALQSHEGIHCVWQTDQGPVIWKYHRSSKACQLMPELIKIRTGLYLNPRRLSRISQDSCNYYIEMDNGQVFTSTKLNKGLPQRFGLPNLVQLEPRAPHFYSKNYLLRDWPIDLARASGKELRNLFDSPRKLIAHLIWQRLRYRQLGIVREWADSYRDFWYEVVSPALYRAGFLKAEGRRWRAPEFVEATPDTDADPTSASQLYMLLFQVMDRFIEAHQLFTFYEFGFKEPRPDCRRIGSLRPDVILVTEKESLAPYGLRLHEEFGISLRMLGSQSPLIGSEYFVRALAPLVKGPVRVIAYVDYDTGGWIVGRGFAKQLQLFGLPVERVDYLIRQDCFSAEEKRLYAHPCAMSSPEHITKTKNWVKESGGIDGKPLGIHADIVKPYERVRELLLPLLG